ncbi:Putative ribonuclease H protein At1g65750, partial [Linum perenne]
AISGVQLTRDRGYCKIQFQLDFRCVVNLLQSDGIEDHVHASTIYLARDLLRRDREVQIIYVYREGNHVVDFLGNRGHTLLVGFHGVELNDPILSYWLLYDQLSVSEERLIMNES